MKPCRLLPLFLLLWVLGVVNLSGTTWTVPYENEMSKLFFRGDGVFCYVENGYYYENGTWTQDGTAVYMLINKSVEYRGKITGNRMEGKARNDRATWNWSAVRQETNKVETY